MTSGVDSSADIAALAGVLADRTRAAFCVALLDGRAWTAGELATYAGVARSTASEHLDRLVEAGLVVHDRQGRHRYVRLAGPQTAELIEFLSARAPVRPAAPRTLRASTARAALARARTCYDHLAGALGVGIADAMSERGLLERGTGWAVTPAGLSWLADLGADLGAEVPARGSRPFARACLDWTERRPHLAGAAGAALCRRLFDRGWLERIGTGRAVRLTGAGERGVLHELGLDWSRRAA